MVPATGLEGTAAALWGSKALTAQLAAFSREWPVGSISQILPFYIAPSSAFD